MRKAKPKKRVILPDPVFGEVMVAKFVNHLMLDGKKNTAYGVFYTALDVVEKKFKAEEKTPLEVWKQALDNITPLVEVKSKRIGGATFQVPTEIRADRKESISMKNMILFARKRGGHSMAEKLAAEIGKNGILFESKKLREAQLPGFIAAYLKRKSVDIEVKASEMMAEFVGADLNRMAGELEKLVITLPQGVNRVTPEQIEQNIGISKDYNNYELRNALVAKDVLKANKIIKYFVKSNKYLTFTNTLSDEDKD